MFIQATSRDAARKQAKVLTEQTGRKHHAVDCRKEGGKWGIVSMPEKKTSQQEKDDVSINDIDRIQVCGTEIGFISADENIESVWEYANQVVKNLVVIDAPTIIEAAQLIDNKKAYKNTSVGFINIRINICGDEMVVYNESIDKGIELSADESVIGISLYSLDKVIDTIIQVSEMN